MSVVRVCPHWVVVCPVFQCDYRALLVLSVHVHCSFDNALVLCLLDRDLVCMASVYNM